MRAVNKRAVWKVGACYAVQRFACVLVYIPLEDGRHVARKSSTALLEALSYPLRYLFYPLCNRAIGSLQVSISLRDGKAVEHLPPTTSAVSKAWPISKVDPHLLWALVAQELIRARARHAKALLEPAGAYGVPMTERVKGALAGPRRIAQAEIT